MDITLPTTTVNNTNANSNHNGSSNTLTKTPEPETVTPTKIQPIKSLTFTNGVLKRHHLHQHHHGTPVVVSYKECLRNHAATLGGHALDGCGEFMPSPSATHTDPTSLKCAACGCHRNFHRREPEDSPPPLPPTTARIEYQPHHRHHPPPPPPPPPPQEANRSPNSSSPPPISSAYYPSAPHMLLALSGHGASGLPDSITGGNLVAGSASRKRFRTKFTQEQKERMQEFAERLGWRMQKRDDELIREFCNQVKVDKGVLKVWMHNNKNTFNKSRDIHHHPHHHSYAINIRNNNNNVDIEEGQNNVVEEEKMDSDDMIQQQQQQLKTCNNNIHGVGHNGSSSSS